MSNRNFTRFSRQERIGLFVFLLAGCIIWTVGQLGRSWYPSPEVWVEKDVQDSVYLVPDRRLYRDQKNDSLTHEKTAHPLHRFRFNPNTLGYDSLRLLGFSVHAVRNLLAYRNKGGVIRSKEKLAAMYGMDLTLLHSLDTLIVFQEVTARQTVRSDVAPGDKKGNEIFSSRHTTQRQLIELNTADSLSILALESVGPYLCHKILRMRRRLGGYYAPEQLMHLRVIPDSVYQIIRPWIKTDPTQIVPVNINTADYKTLVRHPMFTPDIARAILQYRAQHGAFSEAASIRHIRSIRPEQGEPLMPYLSAGTIR